MKVISGIIAFIVGLAAVLGSVGLQTIWSDPEERTAEVRSDVEDVPLTVITSEIDADADQSEPITYTLKGEGDFTLMLGQTRDVEAWVDDAAHNTVTGINVDTEDRNKPEILVEHTEGATDIPNPTGSDLWVATQTVSDEVTQRWTTPTKADWSLLVYADGENPAPYEMSITWTNTDPDSPWITPLMVIGIILMVLGILLILWWFFARNSKKNRPSGRRAAGRRAAGVPVAAAPVSPGDDRADDATTEATTAPVAEQDSTSGTHQEIAVISAEEADQKYRRRSFGAGLSTLLAIAGLVVGLSINGGQPAQADSSQSPSSEGDIEEQVDEDAEDNADATEDDGDGKTRALTPIVLETQLEDILEQVAAKVKAGDEAHDTQEFASRVGGQASNIRSEFYRNYGHDEESAAPEPVPSGPIQSMWVGEDGEFPRTISAVVGDDSNAQYVVLRQESAREQYKLIFNSPLIADAEIPVNGQFDVNVAPRASDDGNNRVMSPKEAVDAIAEYFDDPDAASADQIADNALIDEIHESQTGEESDAISRSFQRRDFDATQALDTPDGTTIVSATISHSDTWTKEQEGVTLSFGGVADALLEANGGSTEADSVTFRYREQISFVVPESGEIQVIGYQSVLSDVNSN